jgi:hypothetical protein
MPKYTVKFKINTLNVSKDDAENLEYHLHDLLMTSVLPALNCELVPVTFEVRKARS